MTDHKPTKYYFLPVVLSLCIALGLWIGKSMTNGINNSVSGGSAKYQKMQDIIDVLDQRYVDSLNGEALFEQTISDMLHKLDPHSNYIAAKDLELMNESIQGQFGGIQGQLTTTSTRINGIDTVNNGLQAQVTQKFKPIYYPPI